jgi:predicted AAA+ superfamily ATPase
MFARKAYDKLLAWKQGNGKTAMLIEGARRTGKSTLAEQFAKQEYSTHLLIDFSTVAQEVKDIFEDQRIDMDEFMRYLLTFYGVELKERDALIIFDEVQLFPIARSFIKHLVADGRYDYLETGSLISIKKNVQDILIPSEEDSMDLNPLDFEEFLWATGNKPLADAIKDSFHNLKPLPEAIHRKAERAFREYMLVGGMPQAIQTYIDTNSFEKTDKIKRRILNLYKEDIAKFGDGESARAKSIFAAIPGQLAKHEKKFTLAAANINARYRDYTGAFFWLQDARMVNICYSVSDPSVGLDSTMDDEDNRLKCYLADTGLLVSHTFADRSETPNDIYRDILFDKLSINEGMLTENVIAQQLRANGNKLRFYSSRDDNNAQETMEIDFLLVREYDNANMRPRISPVEVKSTKTYHTSSLTKFKQKFDKRVGKQYILHPKPLSVQGDTIRLPLYMSGCL